MLPTHVQKGFFFVLRFFSTYIPINKGYYSVIFLEISSFFFSIEQKQKNYTVIKLQIFFDKLVHFGGTPIQQQRAISATWWLTDIQKFLLYK